MKKNEILKKYTLNKLDDITVFIRNAHFDFSYTVADNVLKEECKGKYRYFGGLQCNYNEGSEDYKNLEKWLCEIAENVLNCRK